MGQTLENFQLKFLLWDSKFGLHPKFITFYACSVMNFSTSRVVVEESMAQFTLHLWFHFVIIMVQILFDDNFHT